jgi:hypothetical protein
MTAERAGTAPRLDPADGGICFIQTWEMPAEAQVNGWLATMHDRIHVLTSRPGFRSMSLPAKGTPRSRSGAARPATPTCSKPSIFPTLVGLLADGGQPARHLPSRSHILAVGFVRPVTNSSRPLRHCGLSREAAKGQSTRLGRTTGRKR